MPTQITSLTFCAFDLETTGYDPTEVRICEFAASRFKLDYDGSALVPCHLDGSDSLTYHKRSDPGVPIPPEANGEQKQSDEDVATALPEDMQVEEFIKKMRGTVWLAHNAAYDYETLVHALMRARKCSEQEARTELFNAHVGVIDTLRLARHLVPTENHKLNTLFHYYGCPRANAPTHRADDDVRALVDVFQGLVGTCLEGFAKDWPITEDDPGLSPNFCDELFSTSYSPVDYGRINFGKHRNDALEEVPFSYFDWWINKRRAEDQPDWDREYTMAGLAKQAGVNPDKCDRIQAAARQRLAGELQAFYPTLTVEPA